MSPITTRAGHRAQQAGKTSLWLIVHCFGMGRGHYAAEYPNRLRAPEHRLIRGPLPPGNPMPCRRPTRRFSVWRPRGPASSDVLCGCLSDSCDDGGTVSAVGRQRPMLAGPHPRSRCSSTWHPSAGAALGTPHFARRSSRRRYAAEERLFRALRPGLRREYPLLKLTYLRVACTRQPDLRCAA
jgi:hypothetical protein